MAKQLSPNVALWWIPEGTATWNPDAPSAAILTDVRNFSKAVVSGYTLNPTDSDTAPSNTIDVASNSETPTFYNYEGNVTFEREEVGAGADTNSARTKAFTQFKTAGSRGYWVRRIGFRDSVAAAATQKVDVFFFEADHPQDVVEDGGVIQYTVPFLPQGKMVLNVALAA